MYGRFRTHVAVRGKNRRMAIFSFITNCKPNEIEIFFNLVFEPFLSLFGTLYCSFVVDINSTFLETKKDGSIDLLLTLENIAKKYDAEKTMSLNKIRRYIQFFSFF